MILFDFDIYVALKYIKYSENVGKRQVDKFIINIQCELYIFRYLNNWKLFNIYLFIY